jgi:isopenicillin-N epimerase
MDRSPFQLRPGIHFLNHGSFGSCPLPVFQRYQEIQREIEAQPVEFLGRRLHTLLAEARAELARFVGAGTDDLVFVPNATTGLNIVARSLALGPGDEVLTTDHEYGALDRTWRFLAAKRGFRYIRQPLPLPLTDPRQVVEAVWSGRTDSTRVLFLSHLTAPTALTLPVAELVQLARENGIISIIDGAHAPGQVDLNLDGLGADFYAGNCHKWMMAPKGAAFLHARKEMQHLVEPLVVSWGYEAEEPGPSRFIDEQEWTGTRDPSAWLSVPAAIAFMRENGWAEVRNRCHQLILDTHRRYFDLTGLTPICPAHRTWFTQMAAFPLPPGTDWRRLKADLYERFQVEIPIVALNGVAYLRASAQGYNLPGDYDRLLEGLEALLKG